MAELKGAQSVKKNFVMNFILTISTFIFPLVTFPYASRILLPVGTGKVAFAMSVVSYFTMVGMLGIPTYGIRACAKVRDDKEKLSRTVQELMLINVLAMSISLVAYLVTIALVPRFAADRTLFLINGAALILNLIGCDWLYKGLEQYQYITIRSVLMKGIAIVLMFLLVKNEADYPIYGAITVMANVGSYLLNFIHLRHFITLKPYKELNIKQHLKPALTFFMMTVATTIYTSLDAIMLGFIKGDEAVGYYNAAVNIKTLLVSLVTSLGAVLLPRLSVYIQQQKMLEFRKLTSQALAFVCFSAIPLSLYFVLFAKEGIFFLSGDAYSGSIIPMQLVMPTLLFIGLSNLFGLQILVPTDREMVVVKSVSFGALVNLFLNAIFIPFLGAAGAALGTLVAELVVTAYQAYALKDFLKTILGEIDYGKLVGASILAGGLAYCLSLLISDTAYFLTLAITATVFGLAYLVLLVLLREKFTLSFIKETLNK